MDHLPTPAEPIYPPVEVPYLCDQVYDNGEFSSYPQRRGWDKDRLQRSDFTEHAPDKTAAFLQEWLYFGMLSEILGDYFEFENFVGEVDDGRSLVTTVCLIDSIAAWKRYVDTLTPDDKAQSLKRTDMCLSEAYRVGRHFGLYMDYKGESGEQQGQYPVTHEVALSMIALASSLYCARQAIWNWSGQLPLRGDAAARQQWPHLENWSTSKFLVSRLLKSGWCPSEVYRMRRSLNSAGQYFVSLLSHIEDESQHSKCSKQQCVANNIDEAKYSTVHTSSLCECDFLGAPIEVESIIKRGLIPTIRVSQDLQSDKVRIEAIAAGSDQNFVAFSHLWSDGLGNTMENSLPTCQLLRLSKLARSLYDKNEPRDKLDSSAVGASERSLINTVPFWIDTMCIPRSGPVKRMALARMTSIYETAHSTLVLDTELLQMYRHSLLETLLRIQFSKWNRRLWTFQECVLTKSECLFVQFADGPFPVHMQSLNSEKMSMLNKPFENLFENSICLETMAWFTLHRIYSRMPEDVDKLVLVWTTIQGRSTSKPGDEVLIMGSLLGLDTGELWATPVHERMDKLYRMRKSWPIALLYSEGPRMPSYGLHWAPRSFLDSWTVWNNDLEYLDKEMKNHAKLQSQAVGPGDFAGFLTDQGLMVCLPGFLLLPKSQPLQEHFFFQNIEDQQYYRAEYVGDSRLWEEFAPRRESIARPALISMHAKTSPKGQVVILVSVYREEGGVMYARYVCRMAIYEITKSGNPQLWGFLRMNRHWDRPDIPEEMAKRYGYISPEESLTMTCVAQSTFDDQKWVVG